MNKENYALKLVDEIILYHDARSKKHQIAERNFCKDLDVAQTRQYGGTASRVMFINPSKTYTELHLNSLFLPNSEHIPSGL